MGLDGRGGRTGGGGYLSKYEGDQRRTANAILKEGTKEGWTRSRVRLGLLRDLDPEGFNGRALKPLWNTAPGRKNKSFA